MYYLTPFEKMRKEAHGKCDAENASSAREKAQRIAAAIGKKEEAIGTGKKALLCRLGIHRMRIYSQMVTPFGESVHNCCICTRRGCQVGKCTSEYYLRGAGYDNQ